MNAISMNTGNRQRQRGFTLMEALVSLLVMAFGMLAIAGFQVTLSRNADVAKQRTEATRLAQEKLEQLRSFPNLTAYANQMVSSTIGTQETITTNATYTRTWGVAAAGTVDTGRAVVVGVNWADRAGAAQQVQLFSSISASDPAEVGGLWFPLPDGKILRRPKDRDIDIPIPAMPISGTDKSYIPWTAGTFLVFSNVSGDIVLKCTSTPTAGNIGDTNVCTPSSGYILSGYISGGLVALATGISFSSTNWMAGSPECVVDQAFDQNSPTTPLTGFKYYTCLIQPTDHDSSPATALVWTGRVDISGSFAGGTKTCRYTTDASTTDNNKHPATYTLVDRSLDNQNFNVTSSSCATGSVLHKTN